MFQNLLFPELQSSVYKRTNTFIKDHNKCQGQDGLKYHVRDGVRQTFDKIVAKYNKEFWAKMKLPIWADADTLPTCWVSRYDIANMTGCKIRCVGDRIARLCHLDMIRVHARGYDGYKITLNPYFLFGSDSFETPKVSKLKFEKGEKFKIFLTPEVQSLHTIYSYNLKEKDNKYKAEEVQISLKNERTGEKNYGRKNTVPTFGQIIPQTGFLGDSYLPKSKNDKLGGAGERPEPINEAQAKDIVNGLFGNSDNETPKPVVPINFQQIADNRVSKPSESERIAILQNKSFGRNTNGRHYLANNQRITEKDKVEFVNIFFDHMALTIYPKYDIYLPQALKMKEIIRTEVFNSFAGDNNYTEWRVQLNLNLSLLDQHARYNEEHQREAYWGTSWLKKYDDNGHRRKANFHCITKFIGKSRRVLVDELKERKLERAISSLMYKKYPKNLRTPEKQNMKNLFDFWFIQLSRTTSIGHTARFYQFVQEYYFSTPQQKNETTASFQTA